MDDRVRPVGFWSDIDEAAALKSPTNATARRSRSRRTTAKFVASTSE